MNNNISSVFASLEMEGLTFTPEQKQFIIGLIERIDNKEITWEQAIEIVKERHSGKNGSN